MEAATMLHNAGNRTGEGRACNLVGLAQLYSGDYARSLQNFNLALAIARADHDVEAEITRLNNIGNIFYFQGHYSESLDRYQEAQRLVESFPREKWSASRRQLTLANTAILYQTLGQFEPALELYTVLLNSPQALPPNEEAQLLANVGALRRRLGDPQKALATYRAAQLLYKKAAHRDGEIAVLNNIGIVEAMDLSDFPAALHAFTRALQLATHSGDRPLVVHAHLYRGETLYRAGRLQQSALDFQAAADEAASLGESEERWKALYGLARIAERNGDAGQSDQLLRRAVELIESLRAGLGSSLRSDFLADKRDVYDLLIKHTTDLNELFGWMERSRERTLQDQIRAASARDLGAVARALPADTAVLEYWMGGSSAAVLWISSAQTGVRRWVLTVDDRKDLSRLPSLFADSTQQNWKEIAQVVAQKFIAGLPPLEQSSIHHLIIIPDGDLGRLPFEALPLDTSRLLLERFSVSYSPSASLLVHTATRRAVLWPWQHTLEAFADPSPGVGQTGLDLAAMRAWPRLPEAEREVKGIARILRGRSALHLGADARKEFLRLPSRAPLLHLATHAFADMQVPERSYVILAPSHAGQHFDYLFLKEVSELHFSGVDLVTLSACETGAGKLVRGEGLESFNSAFLGAGAHSVVASLWDVDDKATAEIMLKFYDGLAANTSKADALRAAKLAILRQPSLSHPAYWASFVLTGDGDGRIPCVIQWNWITVPVVLLVCAIVLLFRRKAGKRLLYSYFHHH
jgi:CHAT domain-containing protein/tetratricopeptide (TPR) repeat protein